MSLEIVAIKFNKGEVKIEVDNDEGILEMVNFDNRQDEQDAFNAVSRLLRGTVSYFQIGKVSQSSTTSNTSNRIVTDLSECITKIRNKPKFILNCLQYRAELVNKTITTDFGSDNVFTLELTANDVNRTKSDVNALIKKCRTDYANADIELVREYARSGKRTYIFSLHNNASQYLGLADDDALVSLIELGVVWDVVREADDVVVFKRQNSYDSKMQWGPTLAEATIKKNFDVEKVLFIDPILPYVVVAI